MPQSTSVLAAKYYVKCGKPTHMPAIGEKPVLIPKGVSVEKQDGRVIVHGAKGVLERVFREDIAIELREGEIIVTIPKPFRGDTALRGTYASHLTNMIRGVVEGYEKKLLIEGIGYQAQLKGTDLVLSLGFSHPVVVRQPEGVVFTVGKNQISISGIDKEKVGQAAAFIRSLKKPEPYKGKGIRYDGEVIRRKAGKKVAGAAGSSS